MLRLLPDFNARVDALIALWPAIHDRANVLAAILDLDHPAVLPGSPGAHGTWDAPGSALRVNDTTGQGGVLTLGQSFTAAGKPEGGWLLSKPLGCRFGHALLILAAGACL